MFSLQIISGGMSGQKKRVSPVVKMGRAPGNDICFSGIDGGMVSGQHAIVEDVNSKLQITDNNSTNGTYVNGERVDKCFIQHNDIISLGLNGPKLRVISHSEKDITSEITLPSFDKTQQSPPQQSLYPGQNAGNFTLNLAQKFQEGSMDTRDMESLIKDQNRLKRMEHSGLIADRDLKMINNAQAAFSRSRKKSLYIISSISVTALVVVAILLVQNMGYRGKLKEQKRLLENISELNSQLDSEVENPHLDESEKLELVAKLRAQERLLSRLRGKIASKDLARMYKDPLGIRIHKAMESFGEHDYIVPDIFIQSVKKYLVSWKHRGKFIRNALENKRYHGDLILRELDRANLPSAFLYLAMHESSLDSTIVSHAGARGLWQFMPRTGRDYGLRVPADWKTAPPSSDERTDPLKSTRAAIKYLKVLLGQFGTVPLAMAAYNAGEGRISRELRKIEDPINNRDFWYIYRSGTLAKETNEYVPKIVATMLIDQDRSEFGF